MSTEVLIIIIYNSTKTEIYLINLNQKYRNGKYFVFFDVYYSDYFDDIRNKTNRK